MRDYWPYWFTETKESICIKIEFNSQRFSLDTNMAAISLFWDTNMAVVMSCENTLYHKNQCNVFARVYIDWCIIL